jgi:predicted kinase
MMIGLSGTGKSFLARALACRAQSALVSSDAVRRSAVSEPPRHTGWGEAAYTDAQRSRVYARMMQRAAEHLAVGRSVVLDATFIARADRAAAIELASSHGVALLAVEVIAPDEVVRRRMAAREQSGALSDARWDTYLEQRHRFEPPSELPADQHLRVDGTRPLEELIPTVLRAWAAP